MNKKDLQWIHRAFLLCFMDVISIMACATAALWIRYDFQFHKVPVEFWRELAKILPIWVITLVLLYYGMRLYHSIWQFAGISEVVRATIAYLLLIPIGILEIQLLHVRLPLSVYFMAYVLCYTSCVGIRLSYRMVRSYARNLHRKNETGIDQIMIIGGGEAARYLIREFQTSNHIKGYVRCIIDDNHNKWGRNLEGVPIVGRIHCFIR